MILSTRYHSNMF